MHRLVHGLVELRAIRRAVLRCATELCLKPTEPRYSQPTEPRYSQLCLKPTEPRYSQPRPNTAQVVYSAG